MCLTFLRCYFNSLKTNMYICVWDRIMSNLNDFIFLPYWFDWRETRFIEEKKSMEIKENVCFFIEQKRKHLRNVFFWCSNQILFDKNIPKVEQSRNSFTDFDAYINIWILYFFILTNCMLNIWSIYSRQFCVVSNKEFLFHIPFLFSFSQFNLMFISIIIDC